MLFAISTSNVNASEEFYVPFPEDHALQFLRGISSETFCANISPPPVPATDSPAPTDPINTFTDFVARVAGTVIVVDHFEDGYESDIAGVAAGTVTPDDTSTRVYGDGNMTNGVIPGDADDIFVSGQVVVFEESIVTATQLNDIEVIGQPITGGGTRTDDGLDGGDRIFATETINVTRAQWAGTYDGTSAATIANSQSGTLFAGAFELFPVEQWGDSFTLPAGEDTAVQAFEWTGMTIMAANDNTVVTVDANADGDFTDPGDINGVTINRGQTLEVIGRNDIGGQTTGGLNQGARVFSSDIVQVNVITGEECSSYQSRWYTLFPDALLGNIYYEPVSTDHADATVIYLYNPTPRTITINWETSAGTQTPITVPAGAVRTQQIPEGTGAKFFTGTIDTFGAFTAIDTNQTTHDWGHASTSDRLMGNIIQVGFAEGDDPSVDAVYPAAGIGENASPVWLIADNPNDPTDAQIEICVDVSGDGGPNTDPNTGRTYDYTFTLDRLDSARLYDGGRDTPNATPAHIDGDQSGMLAFVCDGSDAILAAAWGQDPDNAATADPAIDVGTTVRSVSGDVAFIGDTVFEDIDADGVRDPGEPGIENVLVGIFPPPAINLGNGPGQPIYTRTDFNGSYLFTGLVDGDYTVEVQQPSGFAQTYDADVANGDTPTLDNSSSPTIANASGRLDQDFGYQNQVTTGNVGDTIFSDTNGNGIQDAGEPGIAGIDVQICFEAPGTSVLQLDFQPAGSTLETGYTQITEGSAGWSGTNLNGPFSFNGAAPLGGGNLHSDTVYHGNNTAGYNGVLIYSTPVANGTYRINYGLGDLTNNNFVAPVDITIEGTLVNDDYIATGYADLTTTITIADGQLDYQFQRGSGGSAGLDFLNLNYIELVTLPTPTCFTDTTDGSGNYLFTGLSPNNYTVTVLNPPAGTQNTADPNGNGDSENSFTLYGTGGNLEQDFGYFTPATVTGHLYLDTNGNGVQDTGEPDLPNVDVQITDSNGNLQTVTSDANGDYSATVPPGSTQVKVDESDPEYPTGFIQTEGTDPTTVTAIAGSSVSAGNDGYYQSGAIGDLIFYDNDNSGTFNGGDTGIPNVTVTLTPPAGVDLGSGNGVAISTTTDSNGNYNFVGLPDGNYTVTVTQPGSTNQTVDPDPTLDNTSTVTITGGSTNNDQDFGYFNTAPVGQIGDTIFTDTNGNGVQDVGEPGIQNIVVQLCGDLDDNDATANTCVTDTTDASGNYLFTGVPATTGSEVYTVTVTNPPAGTQNTADPDNGLPNFSQLTLSSGGGNLDQDFGYMTPGTVSGHLYIDTNGNGTQDGSEPDLVNVDVIITDVNGSTQTVTTDGDGNWTATVPPGNTIADVDENDPQYPTGFVQTEGTDPTVATAVAGTNTDMGNDGYTQRGAIGDLIFFDIDNSGTFNTGDIGAPNITVTLTPPAGVDLGAGAGVAITTTTDSNGNYDFDELPDGTYTVTVTPPGGGTNTVDPNGGNDSTSTVVISGANTNNDQDFGYFNSVPAGQIGDTVFTDTNGNGIQDGAETGIASINVQVCPTGVSTSTPDNVLNWQFYDGSFTNTSQIDSGTAGASGTTGVVNVVSGGGTDTFGLIFTGYINIVETGTYIFGTTSDDGSRVFISGTEVVNNDFDQAPFQRTGTINFSATGWYPIEVRYREQGGGEAMSLEYRLPSEGAGAVTTAVPASIMSTFLPCQTQTTDGSGNYLFGGLPAGDYVVTVLNPPASTVNTADPDGGGNSISSVTLNAGGGNLDQDFGYMTPATVTGHLYIDTNGNGTQDGSEPDLANVDVLIIDSNGSPQIVSTDANGDYSATVPPGSTSANVDETDPQYPTGFVQTEGTDPTSVTAVAGSSTSIGIDGYAPVGNISGNVSEDTTGNGAGDTAIQNVTVQLFSDPNGDGNPSDGSLISAATTDSSGNYSFNNVAVGNYVLVEIDPAGFNSSSDGDTSADGDVATNTNTNDNYIPLTLTENETDADNNFVDRRFGSIAGRIWLDEDQDGINDIEETGLTPITVQLRTSGGVLITEVASDENGDYIFPNLPPASYQITVDETTLPSGLDNTAGQFGAETRNVTLPQSTNITDEDFGYIPTSGSVIGDKVWADADADGIQDNGEVGIGNVTVMLIDPGSDGIVQTTTLAGGAQGDDTISASTTTDSDGDYLFTNVTAGDYIVLVEETDTDLTGYSPTSGPQSEGDYDSAPVTVNDGDVITDVDFGFDNAGLNTISDTVWFDADADGVKDAGEDGLPGITVNLYEDADNNGVPDDNNSDGFPDVIGTAITDENGDVTFSGVPDGRYIVGISDNSQGLQGLNATTTAATNGQTPTIDVDPTSADSNPVNIDNDSFGYNNPGSIAGTIWSDADGDGVFDAGETGISSDAVITLLLDADGNGSYETTVSTVRSNADGSYLFDGLVPGDYQIQVSDDGDAGTPVLGTQTGDPDATLNNQHDVTLEVGQSVINRDFGYQNLTDKHDISGTVFYDTDKDGVEEPNGADGTASTADDEYGIAGVTLALYSRAYTITNGRIDINDDGVGNGADGDDHATTPRFFHGVRIVDGEFDINGSGTDTNADDGFVAGYEIINGRIDLNGDGVANNSDDGILPAIFLGSTTTDSDGNYSFTGNKNSVYEVRVTDDDALLGGYDITSGLDTQTANVANADVIDVDFGYVTEDTTGSISGEVFYDENNDALANASEPNFSGVTVSLYLDTNGDGAITGADTLVSTTTTDANGEYIFDNLPAGSYLVDATEADLPGGRNIIDGRIDLNGDGVVDANDDGYYQGVDIIDGQFDADGDGDIDAADDGSTLNGVTIIDGQLDISNNGTVDGSDDGLSSSLTETTSSPLLVNLSEGGISIDNDFGYQAASGTVALSGRTWIDADADGVFDSNEVGLGGIQILLRNDGISPFVLNTETTNPDGTYFFTGLDPANDYEVGYLTDPADFPTGLDSQQPTNFSAGNNRYEDIDLPTAGDEENGLDFGFAGPGGPGNPPTSNIGSLSGTIYRDNDSNSSYTEATDGEYFNVTLNLSVAPYTVIDGAIDINNDGVINSSDDGNYLGIDVIDGQFDVDGDGSITAADDGSVNGVTIIDGGLDIVVDGTVNGSDDGTLSSVVIASTTTDQNGDYSFAGLPFADYVVSITDQNDSLQNVNPTQVLPTRITVDGVESNINAGFDSDARLGSVGNFVWLDEDDDGIFDEGEQGIADVTIQCWYDADNSTTAAGTATPVAGQDNLIRSVTTDANGEYYCTSLPTGRYIVVVGDDNEVLADYDPSAVIHSTAPENDFDSYAKAEPYVAQTASPNLRADFARRARATISGTVYQDADGSGGDQGGGEAGIAGVTVRACRIRPSGRISRNCRYIVTDSSGNYTIPVGVGNWQVAVVTSSPLTGLSATTPISENVTTTAGSNIQDVDFGYQSPPVTTNPVTLSYFLAQTGAGAGEVVFNWETALEVSTLGFDIYVRGAEEWQKVNANIILSKVFTSLESTQYEFRAYGVEGTWFALVDVDANENVTVRGPFRRDEEYGEIAEDVESFDWSKVNTKSTDNNDSNTINQRLNNLLDNEERGERE